MTFLTDRRPIARLDRPVGLNVIVDDGVAARRGQVCQGHHCGWVSTVPSQSPLTSPR
jgi:hypothetical protein